jgi:hypothetical protein
MSRVAFLMVIALYGLGFAWCREMIPRWREDWKTIRDPNQPLTEKCVNMLLWGLTAMVIFGMVMMTLFLGIQFKTL